MSQLFYVMFEVPGAADQALRDLAGQDLSREECRVFVHKARHAHSSGIGDSDPGGPLGLFVGLLGGGVGGALLGWLLAGPLRVLPLPMAWVAGSFTVLGLVLGGLSGWFFGPELLRRGWQRLSRVFRPGQTLITVETGNQRSLDIVHRVFKEHGAIELSR